MSGALRAALGRPVVKAALTSGCVMAVGDVTCQAILRRRQAVPLPGGEQGLLRGNDWARTARFGLVGCTLHGPFFLYGFRWLDAALAPLLGPAVSLRNSAAKTLTGNLTIFPAYITAFYAYMGLLEGRRPGEVADKVRRSFWPSFSTGFLFWATANMANFQFVPPGSRVYYVQACGLLWNSYLSWANQQYGGRQSAATEPGADASKRR
mmetsp:Transcript_18058/g.45725  ORF Transcript_18058/g.45725 Transcript_18058/m.45725 type:complete len:208 (+) Transcript_18058:194-817(+)